MNRDKFSNWLRHERAESGKPGFSLYLEPEFRPILDALQYSGLKQSRLGTIIFRAWAEEKWLPMLRQTSPNEVTCEALLIPRDFDIGKSRVYVNGKRVKDLQVDLPHDFGYAIFPETESSFGVRFVIPRLNLKTNQNRFEISFCGGDRWDIPNPLQSIWIGPSWGDFPDSENLARIGNAGDTLDPYIVYGATFIYKLETVLRNLGLNGYDTIGEILDWGCGCSRMIRFIQPTYRDRVTGADIDPKNIAWNRAHMPGVKFVQIPIDGPTPFRDGQFGLIYGNSVFTHLNETDQFYWLDELARITTAEGIVAVTVHSDTSWSLNGWYEMEATYQRFMRGISVSDRPNPDIADVPGNRYTDTSHTHAYIFKNWSKSFHVLSILENFSGPQALVVLRRKSS